MNGLNEKQSNAIIMDKLKLINIEEQINKNFTPATRKKIRNIVGIRTERQLIKLAQESGVDLGVRPITQQKRTYEYFASIVNERIEDAREIKKTKPKDEIKIKRTKAENLGRNVNSMYKKINKITTPMALVSIIGKNNKIYHSTILDKKHKNTLSRQFRDFIMYSSDETILDAIQDKTASVWLLEGVDTKGKRVKQSFKYGAFNCLLDPIREFIEDKIENSQSKKTQYNYQSRLNKVIKLNEKYFDSGINEDKIAEVSNELQVDINVSLPFQNNYITAKSQKKPLRTFNYINTRLNHLDYDKLSSGDIIEELTQEELNNKVEELTENNEYFTYKRGLLGITEIRTTEIIYKTNNHYRGVVNDFEIKNNLLECKLCDIKNKDVSVFVRQGTHLNETINNGDEYYSADLIYGKDFLHIDQKQAYGNYKTCKYYKGFLGKITDFRKCNKIVDIGYYRITNINFKTNYKLREYNEWLNIYTDNNVYPSVELEYLTEQGVEYDIIEGCYGNKIDFDFNEALMNCKTDDGIRYYCKYVGSMMCGGLTNSLYIRGEKDFLQNIVSEVSCDRAFMIGEDELRVVYDKSSNYHLSHIAGFITAYVRLNTLEQLKEFNKKDILRIACDGIYYKPREVKIKNCFRVEEKEPKKNEGGDSYISNYIDYNYNIGYRLEVGEYRENNRVEVHTGQGGAGKTHFNLVDKGFINPCFFAPSYKLSRRKEKDYNIRASVSQKLTLEDPETMRRLRQFYNVLIIDEVSMMSDEDKEFIINNYKSCKIIFCGDIGFQLPCFEEGKTPFNTKGMKVIHHNTNHRVECDKLYNILAECREMMSLEMNIKDFVFNNCVKVERDNIDYNYKEDLIISSTHKGKDYYTEKYKEQEKYYITKSDRIYGRGEICLEKPNTEYCEIRHAYTIHSIQGETALGNLFIESDKMSENRMIYTAISRAKKYEQIKIII